VNKFRLYVIAFMVIILSIGLTTNVTASADEFDDGSESESFSIGDFFSSLNRDSSASDTNEPKPVKKPDKKRDVSNSGNYEPVLDVALSEEFLNSVIKKYIPRDGILTSLYLAFNESRNGLIIRGKITLPKEAMAEYGLPEEIGTLGFQSAVGIRITKRGFLGLVFSNDLTSVWPGDITSPTTSQRLKVPAGFLQMSVARARVFLAILSGDYSSYERRSDVLKEGLVKAEKQAARETGIEKEKTMLYIDELEIEIQLLEIKIKRAKLRIKESSHIVRFVGEAEYHKTKNLQAKGSVILLNPNLDKMFPFLDEVRIGDVSFLENMGSRYMNITANSLVRK